MAFLTIFTTPKPFIRPHIAMIQRNALQSWLELGSEVEVLMIGEEEGTATIAEELHIQHLPVVERNTYGTPLVSSIFELARNASDSPLLAYVNADILLFPDFLEAARLALQEMKAFLLVGQRWDLAVEQPIDFSTGWQADLKVDLKQRGRLHPRGGSDYFIYPRSYFQNMPAFAIGRAGWDNWMFYEARQCGWPLVDATQQIQIIHQDHDYGHLPNGQSHYRLPETEENVRLAGGKRTVFNLLDVNWMMAGNRIEPVKVSREKFWREVEIFPLIRLHSKKLGNLFYAIFHPQRAYREMRAWIAQNGCR